MPGGNDKPEQTDPAKLGTSSNGKPMPAAIVATQWKPGQSGNPSGRPRKDKLPTFVDYLSQYFAETVNDPRDGHAGEKIPREQALAMLIGNAALSAADLKFRMECIKIVRDALWPTPKEPAIQINIEEYHDERAIGFFADLDRLRDGEPLTAGLINQALRLGSSP